MIPIKLQIKNFLSYGPDLQTIDFSPHQLILLGGKAPAAIHQTCPCNVFIHSVSNISRCTAVRE